MNTNKHQFGHEFEHLFSNFPFTFLMHQETLAIPCFIGVYSWLLTKSRSEHIFRCMETAKASPGMNESIGIGPIFSRIICKAQSKADSLLYPSNPFPDNQIQFGVLGNSLQNFQFAESHQHWIVLQHLGGVALASHCRRLFTSYDKVGFRPFLGFDHPVHKLTHVPGQDDVFYTKVYYRQAEFSHAHDDFIGRRSYRNRGGRKGNLQVAGRMGLRGKGSSLGSHFHANRRGRSPKNRSFRSITAFRSHCGMPRECNISRSRAETVLRIPTKEAKTQR